MLAGAASWIYRGPAELAVGVDSRVRAVSVDHVEHEQRLGMGLVVPLLMVGGVAAGGKRRHLLWLIVLATLGAGRARGGDAGRLLALGTGTRAGSWRQRFARGVAGGDAAVDPGRDRGGCGARGNGLARDARGGWPPYCWGYWRRWSRG